MKSARHMILATLTAIAVSAATPAREQEKVYELPASGKNLERQSGGWINFSISGARAVVRFFDPKKKPTAPDVSRGLAIFRYASKANWERTAFHVEQDALVSPSNVRPPHNFRVHLTLLGAEDLQKDPEAFVFAYP